MEQPTEPFDGDRQERRSSPNGQKKKIDISLRDFIMISKMSLKKPNNIQYKWDIQSANDG